MYKDVGINDGMPKSMQTIKVAMMHESKLVNVLAKPHLYIFFTL